MANLLQINNVMFSMILLDEIFIAHVIYWILKFQKIGVLSVGTCGMLLRLCPYQCHLNYIQTLYFEKDVLYLFTNFWCTCPKETKINYLLNFKYCLNDIQINVRLIVVLWFQKNTR